VVAFKDNSSAIRGFEVTPMLPRNPGGPSALAPQKRDWDLLLTAETHNFPCAVAPYPGVLRAVTLAVMWHVCVMCYMTVHMCYFDLGRSSQHAPLTWDVLAMAKPVLRFSPCQFSMAKIRHFFAIPVGNQY
jgi:hypothetical protein